MLSIKEILVKEPYASFEEIKKIKRYIEEEIFDQEEIKKKINRLYWCDKKDEKSSIRRNELLLRWDYFHILMYEFIQKKIKKQLYSLYSFKEGLEVIKKANYKAKANDEINSHFLDDYQICFDELIISWTDHDIENQHKEYEEIPAKYCVLWGLWKRLKRSNFDSTSLRACIESEENRIACFKELKPQIKDDVASQLGDSTYKTFIFSAILSDNASISVEVFLLLDKSDDGKSIIFEPINFDSPNILDLIFHMFFYAYWHNKSFLTKIRWKNKIEKFGFLYHGHLDEDEHNIFEHKFPKKLTKLFDQLYKKIKEKDWSPIALPQKSYDLWKKIFKAIAYVSTIVAAIASIIALIKK